LGASKILNPDDPDIVQQILEITGGIGSTVALECAGSPHAQRLILDTAARNGRIAFVGESGDLNIRVSDDLIRNGLTLYGIWHYNLAGVAKLFQVLENSADQIDKLITHTFSIDDVEKAWKLQSTRQCGKVIIKPFQ